MVAISDRYMTWGSDAYNRLIAGLIDGLYRDGLLGPEHRTEQSGLCRCLASLPKPSTFGASTLDGRGGWKEPGEMCVDTDEARVLFQEYRGLVEAKGRADERNTTAGTAGRARDCCWCGCGGSCGGGL